MVAHVVRKGRGDPVVLLHSGGMSSRQWRRIQERLAGRYEVAALDFLGCGENPPWPDGAPFHLGLDVALVSELLAELGRPAHVVGHSYGGHIALEVARAHPESVRSLVVYDPVTFGVIVEAQDAEGLVDLERSAPLLDPATGGTEAWMEGFIDYWTGAGGFRALAPEARAAFVRVAPKVFLEVRALAEVHAGRDAYRGIEVPVLLLYGERSPPAARRITALLEGAMPRATRRAIEGAGHMGPITHGEAVCAAIEAHLG